MMFQRLARNFIKNGYFPTDEVTLALILKALTPAPAGNMAIFDPTAGEGVALAECKAHLGTEHTRSYGIEIDEERAYHAKTLLDDCIHGNLMDCVVDRHSFGLLFFNPPYGDLSTDHTGGSVPKCALHSASATPSPAVGSKSAVFPAGAGVSAFNISANVTSSVRKSPFLIKFLAKR